ncbi:MAG: VCBS domain-containing protein [Cyanobacteria bacterium P01_C01_bin.72]
MTTELSNNTTNNLAPDLMESEPIVTTDKADYAPGETAEIIGNGFTPGSEVVVQIVDDPTKPGDDGDVDEYQPITVITDEFGTFNTTWFVPTDDDGTGEGIPDALNATLFLTATGTGADGVLGTDDDQIAETTFTDGRPSSNNRGSYSSRSQNTGQDNVEVSFNLYTDVADTDSSSDRGFFPGAVASYTETTFSTFNQTTTTNADFTDLDLSVFLVANFPNYVEINYSFRDPSTNTSVGSFDLIFETNSVFGFPNVPNNLPVDSLVNDIEFIAENVLDTYSSALDSFFGAPSARDDDSLFNDDLNTSNDGETIVPVAPLATDNTAAVTEDLTLTASGNLITDDDGAGTDNDDGLSSQPDFDNLSITGIAGITDSNTDVVGTFGTLDWNTDGSYTYTLDNNNPTVQALGSGETLTDTFSYTLLDDENLSDTANLNVTINGIIDNDSSAPDPEPDSNNIDGTRNDDNINGTSASDFIAANNGNDTVNARGGNDTVEGGRGGDIISGGAGDDILAADRVDRFNDFDGETSEIRGNSGDDTIFGGAKNDLLIGNSGNDSIFGKSGDDELRGGRGDDLLNGGVGNDRIIGGQGIDTADYSDLTINGVFGTVAGLDANLRDGVFKHSSSNNALTWTDTISGIENITGTQRNDRFVNKNTNNVFDGQGEVGRSDRITIFTSVFGDGDYGVTGDVVEYQGNSVRYSFAGNADNFTVTRNGQTDTLIDIEFVKFNDGVFATAELNFV